MRVKLDENLPLQLRRLFTESGHDAATVLDQGIGGATDARLCHCEPFGYSQGKLREESRTSDHPALRFTDPGFSGSMYSLWALFVRM